MDERIEAVLKGAKTIEEKIIIANERRTQETMMDIAKTIIEEMRKGTAFFLLGMAKAPEGGEDDPNNKQPRISLQMVPGPNNSKNCVVFTSEETMTAAGAKAVLVWPIVQIFTFIAGSDIDGIVFNLKGNAVYYLPKMAAVQLLGQAMGIRPNAKPGQQPKESVAAAPAEHNEGSATILHPRFGKSPEQEASEAAQPAQGLTPEQQQAQGGGVTAAAELLALRAEERAKAAGVDLNGAAGANGNGRVVIRRAPLPADFVPATIMGAAVANAFALPGAGKTKDELSKATVLTMRNSDDGKEAGTFSQSISMILAEIDALVNAKTPSFNDAMDNIFEWRMKNEYTPDGECFGIDEATESAIMRYATGEQILECGDTGEAGKGAGAVARILPYAMLLLSGMSIVGPESRNMIHTASRITHKTPESMLACELFALYLRALLFTGRTLDKRVAAIQAVSDSVLYYRAEKFIGDVRNEEDDEEEKEAVLAHTEEMEFYEEIRSVFGEFKLLQNPLVLTQLPGQAIKSTGNAAAILSAALWCFMGSRDYVDCVRRAANLGGQADVIATIAGALAGAYYGLEAIPEPWRNTLKRHEYIEALATLFQGRYFPERNTQPGVVTEQMNVAQVSKNSEE